MTWLVASYTSIEDPKNLQAEDLTHKWLLVDGDFGRSWPAPAFSE